MNLDELRNEVEQGAVDTVLLVMTDMQGRLMGKRLHAPFFVSDIAAHVRDRSDELRAAYLG